MKDTNNYIKTVHVVSLLLLLSILLRSPFYLELREETKAGSNLSSGYVYVPEQNFGLSITRVKNLRNKASAHDNITAIETILPVDIETERQNRALIVYTLLAMYLGSGYLLFKKN